MLRVSNKNIIQSVAGVLYKMHPYHNPEKIEVIIKKFDDYFREKKPNDTFCLVDFESEKDLYKFIKEFLMSIPEFLAYNISQKKKDEGVKNADDERNQGIVFSSRYDVESYDRRYFDFIDLDAAIGNITNEIIRLEEDDADCFLCKFALKYGSMEPSDCKECETCIANPKYKCNRIPHPMSLKPKNQWTEEEKENFRLW